MTAKKTNAVSYTRINEITECPICSEAMRTPKTAKLLPCGHTFCLEYLRNYGADAVDGDKIACPLWREKFVVPVGGFETLRNNIFIIYLLSCNTKETEADSHSFVCQMCGG